MKEQPMQVFIINLDRDSRRLDWMGKQFSQFDQSFERFAALSGKSIKEWQYPMFFRAAGAPFGPLEPGEIGCYGSHLALHKITRDDPEGRPTLILEDDVALNAHFADFLRQIDKLPADWDIIRLSNPPKSAYVPVAELQGGMEVVRYWRIPNNMGCYLISPKGAQKFIDSYPQRRRPIDEDMRRPWEHGMVTYGIVPAPVVLNAFEGSSIDDIAQRTDLPWRKRGQKTTLAGRFDSLAYKLKAFGLTGAFKCLAKNASVSLRKRLGLLKSQPENYRVNR